MRYIEAPSHLLNLFDAGIEVPLQDGDTHSGEDWNCNPNRSTIDRTISELLFDETIFPTADEAGMGTPVHGKDDEWMKAVLAGQKTLVFEYCAHIHGMGQSMLESTE